MIHPIRKIKVQQIWLVLAPAEAEMGNALSFHPSMPCTNEGNLNIGLYVTTQLGALLNIILNSTTVKNILKTHFEVFHLASCFRPLSHLILRV